LIVFSSVTIAEIPFADYTWEKLEKEYVRALLAKNN